MEGLTTSAWMLVFVAATIRPLQSLDATEIPMDYDSPYYVTVYQVIEGSVSGVSGLFEDPELANLKRGDYFTVVLAVKNKTELEKWYRQEQGWYEIPATFCFGDSATKCLSKAMNTNSSANYRRPYIFRPTSSEKHIPLMVPFKNFIFLNTSNKDTLPETGIVHSQFKNFSHLGGRYDTTSGVLASFYLKYSTGVGKMSDITFVRKKRQLQHQPLTECYLVEWAPDGCVPGLNTLMKGWDMKQLKLKSARWLKFGKFPLNRDEHYLETLHTFEKGRKSFLVPKGLTLDSIATGSVPYSKIYSGVKEQLQETLHSLGINYKEELSGAVQGSARVDGYSTYFSGTTFTSAVAGVKYRLFRARFRPSFNFKDSSNWDEEFKRDFNSILTSRDSTETMSFFKEYGTHYLQEAVMGGRKESAFSIKYCSVEKSSSTKFELEAKLKIPYYGVHNVPPQYTYNSTMSESEKENIVYGPVTTCTGGNSLTLEVCMNDTAWRDSVHVKPYPIELAVKPFWSLVSNHSGDREWLQQEYEKYLVAQLGEEEIKADLKMAAHCGGDGPPTASFVTVVALAILTPPTLWLLNRPVSC